MSGMRTKTPKAKAKKVLFGKGLLKPKKFGKKSELKVGM